MKDISNGFKSIWQKDRGLLLMMIINLLAGLALTIFALVTLNPANSVTKIGYGDIGGYRDGSWHNMLAWPLLGFTLGILNNLVAVKIFSKNGRGMARILVGTTMMLTVLAFVVLVRLLGES